VKGRALSRAARIVDEGLRASLDLRDGGALAADLHALYGYLTMRLTAANLRNDEAAIEECQRLLGPLQEAWQAIGPQVNASRR
jgi:flagellar secretion chaperone FliS